MPRKKSRKMTNTRKTTLKRQSKKATVNLAAAMEKQFKDMPATIVSHLRKQADTLNQQVKKLGIQLKKSDTQKKTLKNKQTTLMNKHKQKPSATNKKQLKLINTNHDKAHKNSKALEKQIDQIKLEIRSIATKQAKYAAIPTLLSTFAKQWEIKMNKANKPTATKTRKKTVKKQKMADAATPVHENASFEISAHSDSTNEPSLAE